MKNTKSEEILQKIKEDDTWNLAELSKSAHHPDRSLRNHWKAFASLVGGVAGVVIYEITEDRFYIVFAIYLMVQAVCIYAKGELNFLHNRIDSISKLMQLNESKDQSNRESGSRGHH